MKKLLLIAVIGLLSYSCTSKWEYKTVSVKGEEQETMGKFKTNTFDVSDESLNLFGNEGWELVGIYEKTETAHPNFGNEEYVSGLQPNVRTAEINFVFKRKK
ncbi:MAG TPA: DUF4177 domain-containing protein [Paludibacteraceae bacterium]|jgi:hypothetical protein|nr:DUF4177 domain-containing protein [Paludibacteraceae bacterium]